MFSSKFCKKLNFLLLSALVLFIAFAANAEQKQVFYADFEDGLTGSTGKILTVGNVTIVQDLAAETNAVKVGPSSPDANSTLDYFIGINKIGKDGEVNFKFKIPADYNIVGGSAPGVIKLFGARTQTDNKSYWDIGIDSRKQMRIRSYGATAAANFPQYGPTGAVQTYSPTAFTTPLADGWHTVKFTWQETFAQSIVDGIYLKREQATITLSIDGVEVLNMPEVWWTLPGGGHITLGSWYNVSSGKIACSYRAGDKNILIDDVNVFCESNPAKTQELGKGTVTWSYDAENGFNASSGIAYAYNLSTGEITNPDDTAGSVYTIFDADKNSKAVKVSNLTANNADTTVGSYLNWSNLDMGVVSTNGRIKCAFKVTPTWQNQNAYCAFVTDKYSKNNGHWFSMGATNRGLPFLRSYNANRTQIGNTHTSGYNNIVLENGWHTCELTWQQTVPQTATTTSKANLRMYFDGYLAYEAADANWAIPEQANISVGSVWGYNITATGYGQLQCYYEAGDLGVLIDDVVFEAIPLECGDAGTVYLEGDINKDCAVTMTDVDMMADEWIGCTEPLGTGCVKANLNVASAMNYNAPQNSSIVVNGDLSEWSDAVWAEIPNNISDQLTILDGTPPRPDAAPVAPYDVPPFGYRNIATDVESAVYAVKWNDATDKLYLAVKVNDAEHNFKPFNAADPCVYDRIDIYVQGTNAGGGVDTAFASAQRYTVGADGVGGTWKALGGIDNSAPAVAGINAAASVVGDEIFYEIEITPYDSFDKSAGTGTQTALTNSKVAKLDVTVASRFGSAYGDYGILAANLKYLKCTVANAWSTVTCLNAAPTACGSWGYNGSDTNGDCKVALADFAELAENWNACSDPTQAECDQFWRP